MTSHFYEIFGTERVRVLKTLQSSSFQSPTLAQTSYSNKRIDTNDVVVMQNELLQIAGDYQAKLPDLSTQKILSMKAFSFPENEIQYNYFTSTGKMKSISSASRDVNNIPEVTSTGTPYRSGTMLYATKLFIADQAIMASTSTQRDLYTAMLKAAYRTAMETINTINLFGNTADGLVGIMNNIYVPTPAQVNSATDWSAAATTGAQIYNDVTEACTSISNATGGMIAPKVMGVSPKIYIALKAKMYSVQGNLSVFTMLEEIFDLTIVKMPELTNAFNNGTKDGFILLNNDPECIEYTLGITSSGNNMPTPMFITDPVKTGFGQQVFVLVKSGGVIIVHPKSICMRYIA